MATAVAVIMAARTVRGQVTPEKYWARRIAVLAAPQRVATAILRACTFDDPMRRGRFT
jgi:hypothetical protein